MELDRIVSRFQELLAEELGENLVSLALFGSVARGDFRPDSDIDFLVVCESLPSNRFERWDPILAVEERLRREFSGPGAPLPYISVILKDRREAAYHSPIYLDMVEDALFSWTGGLLGRRAGRDPATAKGTGRSTEVHSRRLVLGSQARSQTR